MAARTEQPLSDHRFVIVAGKGGVGKSTVAMGLAAAAARKGRRTLLFLYGTQGTQTTPFWDQDIGEEIVELEDNLFAVRPSTETAMREYVMLKIKSATAYRVVFENNLVKKMINGIPGVTELVWLGKAFNHEREKDSDGRPVWDTIVLDPPATGHSLYLFQVPYVIRDAVRSGPFHNETRAMVELLQDRDRTALHLVTLPEEMPANEVIELKRNIDRSMQIPVESLIVNAVFPQIFDETEQMQLDALRSVVPENGDVIDRLVAAGQFRVERRALQDDYLARLRDDMGLPTIEIPYYFVPRLDDPVLADLVGRLDDSTTREVGAQRVVGGAR